MPTPKKEDYRVTRGKALIAEKKRVAANPNKKVVLPSKQNMKNVAGLALTVAGPGKVVKGAKLAVKAVKTVQAAKAAKATTKAGQLARDAKLVAQRKATTTRKTDMSSLQKQIAETEARIKGNAQRAAELAKKPKAPGAPSDRELGLLDANKKLAADLKKLRQTYYDTKTTF